jgi:hypothetical protein
MRKLGFPILLGVLPLGGGVVACHAAGEADIGKNKDYAVTVYYGQLTDNDWQDALLPGAGNLVDSHLAVAALSKTIRRAESLPMTFELEGQVARHFGKQDNWELNLLTAGRWHRFPWHDLVRTTAAFGLGPSYATSTPKYEVEMNGTSKRLLAYWYLEVTAGPPDADWSVSFRLHHRSTAFGLFGKDGGYNALAVGLRYPLKF